MIGQRHQQGPSQPRSAVSSPTPPATVAAEHDDPACGTDVWLANRGPLPTMGRTGPAETASALRTPPTMGRTLLRVTT